MTAPEELHDRALALLVKGDTAGGLEDLRAYLAVEPDDETAWLALGTAYASIGHPADAATALRRAVELDGAQVEARLAYARVLGQLGKLDDAAFQLLQAAKADAPDPRVLRELGIVFYDKRLFDKAALWLGRACAAAPDDARARYALGLTEEARRDMGAAVASYREAVRLDGALTDARRTLADALASMGEHESAIAELEALLAIERTSEEVAHNRDVLVRALEEMRHHRLLGKGQRELEASALASEGQLRRKGAVSVGAPVSAGSEAREEGEGEGKGEEQGEGSATPAAAPPGGFTVRYAGGGVELYVAMDDAHAMQALTLVLTDPAQAAATPDETFRVTVVGKDGRHEAATLATAVTLTFLREALGCPMTQAAAIYAKLLAGERRLAWAGAEVGFVSFLGEGKRGLLHGLRVGNAGR